MPHSLYAIGRSHSSSCLAYFAILAALIICKSNAMSYASRPCCLGLSLSLSLCLSLPLSLSLTYWPLLLRFSCYCFLILLPGESNFGARNYETFAKRVTHKISRIRTRIRTRATTTQTTTAAYTRRVFMICVA